MRKSKSRPLLYPPPSLSIEACIPTSEVERADARNGNQGAAIALGGTRDAERNIFLASTAVLKEASNRARALVNDLDYICSERGILSPLVCSVRIRYSSVKNARDAQKVAIELSNQSALNTDVPVGEDEISAYAIIYPQLAYLRWNEIERIENWIYASRVGEVCHFDRRYKRLCKACRSVFHNLKRVPHCVSPLGDFDEIEPGEIGALAINVINARMVLLNAIIQAFSDTKPRVFPDEEQIHKVEILDNLILVDGLSVRYGSSFERAMYALAKLQIVGASICRFSRNEFMAYYRSIKTVAKHQEYGTGAFDSIQRSIETNLPNVDIISMGKGYYGVRGLNVSTELAPADIDRFLEQNSRG